MGQTRGRRREKKEKKELAKETADPAGNEPFNQDFIPLNDASDDERDNEPAAATPRDNRSSFFGLLDRSELEYFKNAESLLATNALSADERGPFVSSVFEEAKGRELKLATNQVCSKLVERLTQLASEEQMQQLLAAVEPFAVDLAFQKFSSHCLEAIIVRSTAFSSCESQLVKLAQRAAEFLGDFVTDKYASHVLQTLITALAGVSEETRSKRSRLARKHTDIGAGVAVALPAEVPAEPSASLKKEAREIVVALVDTLDKPRARKLAIDPIASAVIQVLIVADAQLRSGYKLLNEILDESDSDGFVSHCLSDAVGAHFLETAIRVMPAKRVTHFADKLPIAKLATSEMESAGYIVQALLERSHLPASHKRSILRKQLLPSLSAVLDRNAAIIVTALDVEFEPVAAAVVAAFADHELNLRDAHKTALFERLAAYAPFVDKATEFVVALSHEEAREMATDATQSYVLQHLLTPKASIVSRRKLVNKLIPLIAELSLNAYGSHIVDALWPACYKLKFNRERTASELLKHAEQVKHSPYGRKVWHNWRMEKYAHRRHEWWQAVKAVEDELRARLEPDAPVSGPAAPVADRARARDGAGRLHDGAPRPHDRVKRRKTSA